MKLDTLSIAYPAEQTVTYDLRVKKKVPCIVVPLPMYNCHVEIYLPKETREVSTLWGGYKLNCDAWTQSHLEYNYVAVFLRNTRADIVAHEFLHASTMIMDFIGHKITPDGDEPLAYLLGYLIKEFNLQKNKQKNLPMKKKLKKELTKSKKRVPLK